MSWKGPQKAYMIYAVQQQLNVREEVQPNLIVIQHKGDTLNKKEQYKKNYFSIQVPKLPTHGLE